MTTIRRAFFLLTFVAILLAGCVSSETRVNPNGSGSLEVSYTFDREEVEAFSRRPSHPSSICDEASPYVSLTETSKSSGVSCTFAKSFRDLDELGDLYLQFHFVKVNRLEASSCQYVYDVDVQVPQARLRSFDWDVIWPGLIWSNNADSGPHRTNSGWSLKWQIAGGPARNLYIQSYDLSTPECISARLLLLSVIPLLFLLGVIGVVGFAIFSFRTFRGRSRGQQGSAPQPDSSSESLPKPWKDAFHLLQWVLVPAEILLLGLGGVALLAFLITFQEQGPVSALAPLGIVIFVAVLAALPVAYWALLRMGWFRSWRKFVLMAVGAVPVLLIGYGFVALLLAAAACLADLGNCIVV